jgi:hypothetical protein
LSTSTELAKICRDLNKALDLLASFQLRQDEVDKYLFRIEAGIEGIEPATIEVNDRLVKAILRKLGDPLTVPAEIAASWAEMAKYGQIRYMDHFGIGPLPCMLETIIQADGTATLKLSDPQMRPVWSGTLHGPVPLDAS